MGNLASLEQGHGLSKSEVERLERRVRKLGRGRTELARSDLLAVDGLAGNPFTDRIFEMFDSGELQHLCSWRSVRSVCTPRPCVCSYRRRSLHCAADEDRLLLLTDMKALMVALTRLSDEEARFRFAFAVFDTNGDGVIDREELLRVFQLTNKRSMTTPQLEQVVDSTIARWDDRGGGTLSYPAFKSLLLASTSNLSL